MTNPKLSKGLEDENVLSAYHSLESFSIEQLVAILANHELALAHRMRVLWHLRERSGEESVDALSHALSLSDSPLFRHEVAYILGQKGDPRAQSLLVGLLSNPTEDVMVRHEAAEAIGALSQPSADIIALLEKYAVDEHPEIAETCQLALDRMQYFAKHTDLRTAPERKEDAVSVCACQEFASLDPAPPSEDTAAVASAKVVDASLSLFERYRAMFRLRNLGNVKPLCVALSDKSSALFRHEVAFVLGQMERGEAVDALVGALMDVNEHVMVRHEAAEALGSIASNRGLSALQQFTQDQQRAVRESCEVALDMHAYWTQFYAGVNKQDE
eukprot:ANDGO_02597.mRNA.1 Deoxyhypusine hydroxylase